MTARYLNTWTTKVILLSWVIVILNLYPTSGLRPFVAANPSGVVPSSIRGGSGPSVSLETYATGFSAPVDIASTGVPGDLRLFIVEKEGIVRVVDESGATLQAPFIDIRSRVESGGSEQGLLGLAFDPNYSLNGSFYVNYTDNQGDTVVSRFRVNPDEPDQGDPGSEYIILEIDQPFGNHNAGDLVFGPDGYLYIPTGDGGSGGDPGNRAQDKGELLGKLLRIDVGGTAVSPGEGEHRSFVPFVSGAGVPYLIPAENPYVDDPDARGEIWALGLRNPWRASFDRDTGDLFLGDVGQGSWEEVDFQPGQSSGGENYGWRCYEGSHPFNTAGCELVSSFEGPIFEYDHDPSDGVWGCAVTGGYVYRGPSYPSLWGVYLFADFCSDLFWSAVPDGEGAWQVDLLGDLGASNPSTFGEDVNGELFVASYGTGTIFQIQTEAQGP
jgi:glucose/arabinose dehydrogenase